MSLKMRCPVCEGGDFAPGPAMFDDRYGEPNEYRLGECRGCGHTATSPRLDEAQLPGLYGTYYPRKNISAADVSREADKVRRPSGKFLRWWNGTDNQGQYSVLPGEAMLDVGCGSGASLLEAKALGATAFGIEADPNVRPIADALGLTIHFGSLQDQPFPGQAFDLVVLNQVIEHLPDPDAALVTLGGRMTTDGRMVLVFPNTASIWRRLSGRRWINWHIPYHLHHFDLPHFRRMAERCGFDVVRSRTITPNVWTLLQLRAMKHKVERGQPNPAWVVKNRNEPGAPRTGSSGVRGLLRFGVMTTFGLMNRLLDAMRLGDSLIVELRRRKV